jgi:hypothetical protein
MQRMFALILISLISLVSSSFSNAADVIDEQYSLGNQSDKVGILIGESMETLRNPTLLFSTSVDVKNPLQGTGFCSSLEDPKCSTAQFARYSAVLPPCNSLVEVDCIESIYAIVPGSSTRIMGVYRESIPNKVANPYKADPENGLPQGSVAGVWEIPNVKHGGNTADYVAIVSRVGEIKREGSKWLAAAPGRLTGNGDFLSESSDGDFRAAIFPTNIIKDSRYKSRVAVFQSKSDGNNYSTYNESQLPADVCALFGDGICGLRETFPDNVKFGIVIRFSKVISGWMHGRIDSPEIDYELTSYGTRIDMQGEATRVPVIGGWASPTEFSSENNFRGLLTDLGTAALLSSSSGLAMEMVEIWGKTLKETAAANPSQWNFYNLPERDIASASDCIKSSKTLSGFVTTNSTTYTANPPIYNKETGSLDYKVASLHLLPDGKVFKGTYNLYIDSKVARCIYKFSSAPISATVSITTADGGEQNIATTVIGEKNGWLRLSAAGFTFSSPTLKVKLTQEAPTPALTPTPVATVKPVVAKKSTITCLKSKLVKKVSALKPKCPTGWKKKN